MANDWIKMRTDLRDDPAVIRMALHLACEEDYVVGKLHRLWAWADRNTADGIIDGVSISSIDHLTAFDGFGEALEIVGWLEGSSDGIQFPNFDRHMGASAKKRAATQQRVSKHRMKRSGNASVTQVKRKCTQKVTVSRTLRRQIFERDGNTCVYCGRKKGEVHPTESQQNGYLSVDHVIPESRGGDTSLCNLVTCCLACNNTKSNRTPDEAEMKWPVDVTGKRYGSVTQALPEKRREEKRREEKNTSSSKKSPCSPPDLPDCLSTDRFRSAWATWEQHRREKRQPLTPTATKQQLAKLAEMGEDRAVAAIEHSVANGYQGIFEPTGNGRKSDNRYAAGPGQRFKTEDYDQEGTF